MRARCVRLDGPVPDPAAADTRFESPRRALLGWGCATVIELPAPWPDHVGRVAEVLASIDTDDEVGAAATGPVAFGALPFDREAAATLVVPAVIVGTTPDGARWVTTIDDATLADDATPPVHASGARVGPTRLTMALDQSPEAWCDSVAEATRRIAGGEVTKVVLARRQRLTADQPFDPGAIASRLSAAHPHSLRWLIDGFCGASPELLVSRFDDIVRAQPMAGTTPRTGDPAADQHRAAELLASQKNRDEHQITIDMVHDTLLGWCSYLDAEPEPQVVAAGSVQHLATMVEGRLSHPAPSVLDLVAALHPTPAVGGWPRDAAMRIIAELEPVDRGRYAGPVGWVDQWGNGAFAVAIRSVSVDGDTAELWAGVGVVSDSDPAAELQETRAKFAATIGHVARL